MYVHELFGLPAKQEKIKHFLFTLRVFFNIKSVIKCYWIQGPDIWMKSSYLDIQTLYIGSWNGEMFATSRKYRSGGT